MCQKAWCFSRELGKKCKVVAEYIKAGTKHYKLKKAHKDVMICDQMNGKYSSYKHSNLTLHLSEPNSKGLSNGCLGPWSKM